METLDLPRPKLQATDTFLSFLWCVCGFNAIDQIWHSRKMNGSLKSDDE